MSERDITSDLKKECNQVDKCLERLEQAAHRIERAQDLTSIDLYSVVMRLTAVEKRLTNVVDELEALRKRTGIPD